MKYLMVKRLILIAFAGTLLSYMYINNSETNQQKTMKIAVWDTYVQKENGQVMHFDILVPDTLNDAKKVYHYGMQYLKNKQVKSDSLTAKECRFCHIEQATPKMIKDVETKGYSIIEMENCN